MLRIHGIKLLGNNLSDPGITWRRCHTAFQKLLCTMEGYITLPEYRHLPVTIPHKQEPAGFILYDIILRGRFADTHTQHRYFGLQFLPQQVLQKADCRLHVRKKVKEISFYIEVLP